ncbi:MAG: alpha/beta fold hydrolase [Deltaproteobacteria bacterium]|nr:alpha/beta fold hydrolase [Deltaproteobacteria bacterium]
MTRLRHGRGALALHELSTSSGPTLLLLHALGGSAAEWGELPAAWPGRVLALDFSGHGGSDRLRGGVYTPEICASEADAVLAEVGACAVAGAGLGAYAALLLAGGRADQVPAALLLPGRGLAGGGAQPDWTRGAIALLEASQQPPLPDGCDPQCAMLGSDPRPPSYALHFARAARRLLLFEDGGERPPWWEASRACAVAVGGDVRDVLRQLL